MATQNSFSVKKPLSFYGWMNERESIRQKREAGEPWPWTKDPVLQKFSFTNVMREYDRVSIWIQGNITNRFIRHPALWQMLAIARQINWPQSLDILINSPGWPGNMKKMTHEGIELMRRDLDKYQATGAKVYTGAYMIHADSDPRTSELWANKTDYVLGVVIGQLIGKKPDLSSMEAFTKWMSQFESWGGFMSYEVACDLRWAPGWLNKAPDIRKWANPGPGAYRGLNRIAGRPLKAKVKEADAVHEMRVLLSQAATNCDIDFPRPFEMRDIEHSLCEYDKYLRASLGEGKPRAQYHPKLQGELL